MTVLAKIPPCWKHQEQSIKFFSKTPRGFDFSDPGVGKTRVHLEVYNNRPKPKKRLLILCPKTLMVSAWGEDIEKYIPNLTYAAAYAENREEAMKMKTDVTIVNVDGVKWLADKKNQKYLSTYDHLIIDEITALKHSTSQRSKAAASIRKYFTHRYGLTGTPNANSVMEVWHPALIIDDGKRLGTSYFRLRSSVQSPEQIGPRPEHLKWTDKPGASQAINELLSDITIRHEFEAVMKHVPPNHRHVKEFAMSPKAKAIYDKMERDCIAQIDDGVVSAVHAASMRTKLLQIASGAVYDGTEKGSYKVVDTNRYELIGELLEERDHSVVFFNWTHQKEMLCKEFDNRGYSFAVIDGSTPLSLRNKIVDDFQNGKYKVILLHPLTGAHGLTLTRGKTTIFCSPIYEADLAKQAIARIYRGIQDEVTNTIFIQAKGTVEDIVYARLNDKTERMEDLLKMMAQRSKGKKK